MGDIGKKEKETQNRVVTLLRDLLQYDYLGNWTDRNNVSSIEENLLRKWLKGQGNGETLINRALFLIKKVANDQTKSLYDRNRRVYEMLRYGVKVKVDQGDNTKTVWLINWERVLENDFAFAEEVSVEGADARSLRKRPDIVLFVNGIALGVLELKRSTVSVAEGIRQNLDNQNKKFIRSFFSTQQLLMAGNDTEGLRYGTIETPEKYYLTWKEDSDIRNLLDRHLIQVCNKERFLRLIHDFVVFDAGTKKLCRPNQYFGVRAAQEFIRRREGGIIWHTQGSGKSLTMVWLAKWIRENQENARVLIITDRTELDEQIEKVFKGVSEDIYRTKSGKDLINTLNDTAEMLICSLIHKFESKKQDDDIADISEYLDEVKNAMPRDFKAKGNLYVFVDECHRTQSGELHKAMKTILPDALFIGFTGTPLLKADKQKSIEVFGGYIHTYKFDEAVKDEVVLDLRYEARDIDQYITSHKRIEDWFDAKTRGLTTLARAQLKKRWGTLQKLLSSQSRLEMIVDDILMDMNTRPRLMSGHGNAMLVSGSIYQACKLYELFSKTELAGKCAIVTSYKPSPNDIKGESAEGMTENLRKYEIYKGMLAEWFNEDPDMAVHKAEEFEKQVKKKFIEEPGQMKLLIVVDKLLTGFDAPSATYLYIDKNLRDHGLFQAICRVNRLDSEDKKYGYIIDYKDLFRSLEGVVQDYTSGALDSFNKSDVAGLLENRLSKAKEDLDNAREVLKALCEPVEPPRDTHNYIRYFCAKVSGNNEQLKANEPKRLALYKNTAMFLRAYGNLANELVEAGYSASAIEAIKVDLVHYTSVRDEVKQASGDFIDLKLYEPAMRHLIDTYIRAEESDVISDFNDLSLIQLIVDRGTEAVKALSKGIRESKEAVAETIENNVRKLIVDETPINPKYYEKMSELLDALIEQRRQSTIDYKEYLEKIVALTRQAENSGNEISNYPDTINTLAKKALYDNLEKDEVLALKVDEAVQGSRQDGWRNNPMKVRRVRISIKKVLNDDENLTNNVLELVKHQDEY